MNRKRNAPKNWYKLQPLAVQVYHEPTPDLNELAERYAKRAHILILDRIAARNNQTLRRQAALSGLKEYKLSVVDTKT